MYTFAEKIERIADAEIIGIVIGEMGWKDYGEEGKEINRKGVVLSWKEAKPLLDYTYDSGYGAPDCHSITAWTEENVIFVVQYDGSTSLHSVPRNPVAHMPGMPGG